MLPSGHYDPAPGAALAGALPWESGDPEPIIGAFARDHGAEAPARLIVSAKSWLSHAGVDRGAALLPWQGAGDALRLSPGAVSARILAHLRKAWDHAFPGHPLAEQDVVLTVPASFDEVARELTAGAAGAAGLGRALLLEEPQAAFYAWMHRHGAREALAAGETILVCDVGGGTTDLTLIQVREGPAFHRVAVGEHLILGGDNLDLALARFVEQKLGEGQLPARLWPVLVRRCQQAKETLLGADTPESMTLHLPAGGARLVGGGQRIRLERGEVERLLVEGFLPRIALGERPARHASGFREVGLPYAPDPAITRWLSAFLLDAGGAPGGPGPGRPFLPDRVLLNGGFFAAPALAARLVEVLASWRPVRVLEHEALAPAVAIGAAAFGHLRRTGGARIRAGLARSYYIGIAGPSGPAALCLVPAGLEEGQESALEGEFTVRIREPVEFPVYASTFRTGDRPGDLVVLDPLQLAPLPAIRTVLRSGKKSVGADVSVSLHARLSEIGTLEIWCRERRGDRSWRLQFDVRGGVGPGDCEGQTRGIVDEALLGRAAGLVAAVFENRPGAPGPQKLPRALESALDLPRGQWPPALLRPLWEALLEREAGRRLSLFHEARWLNLLGFCLRPGRGFALDDWRVARTWKLAAGDTLFPKNGQCRAEWLILWRRICAGLSAAQQKALAVPLLSAVKAPARGAAHALAESWRLLAALEWLDPALKENLGNRILVGLASEGPGALAGAALWSLGRLGSRAPLYGPLNTLVEPETAARWLAAVLDRFRPEEDFFLAAALLARRTDDRFRDLDEPIRTRALAALSGAGAPADLQRIVAEGGDLPAERQGEVFGESLPPGLRLGEVG